MGLGPPAGLLFAALSVAVAGAAAPSGFSGRPWKLAREAILSRPQARAALGIWLFCVGAGVVMATGAVLGAGLLGVIGAFAGCSAARWYLSGERPRTKEDFPVVWFALLGTSLLAIGFGLRSISVDSIMAAQASMGPAVATGPFSKTASALLAFAAGLVAAHGWASSLPRLAGSPQRSELDRLLRWGEVALASSAVASLAWGPSLAGLFRGPLDPVSTATTLVSVAVGLGVTALVSAAGRFAEGAAAVRLVGCGAAALGAILLAWV